MKSTHHHDSAIIISSILFLFFFQLLADFIQAIYAFGLLNTDLPIEIVCALLLLSPIALLLVRRAPSGGFLAWLGALVLLSRIVEPLLDTRGRMFISGLGVACFLIFFPAFMLDRKKGVDHLVLGFGLTLGVSLSILFRALGSGVDLSTMGGYQAIGWVLAILAALFLFRPIPTPAGTGLLDTTQDQPKPCGTNPWKITGLSLGISAVFVLLYFTFTSPTVIARWTGASYPLILGVLLLAWSGFVFVLAWKPSLLARLTPATLLAWNVLFVLCLELTILAQQIHFPSTPVGYPFTHSVTPFQEVPLILMLLLSPVILADFIVFCREIIAGRPSIRLLGGSFAVGSLFILVMIFAQVFTTVYDYIPVVGPFFRDKFWFVFLVGGVVLTLPVLLVQKSTLVRSGEPNETGSMRIPGACMLFIAITALSGALLTASRPSTPIERGATLRVLTYNIQQGYDRDGQSSHPSQLALLRQEGADVIGLQECDMTRIAGGNTDVVRYFADKLDMYSYYGPSTVAGTFGIALLSRYPIQNPRTFYMYSLGEQTAVIEAQIAVGGKTFNVYVTHLGNDGPIIQQEQVLQLVQGKENVLLMGDFNFRPDTDQYRLTTAMLNDAWLLCWPQGAPSQGLDPSDRIDHIFVSPGMQVIESRYLVGPQSDHPALVMDVGW